MMKIERKLLQQVVVYRKITPNTTYTYVHKLQLLFHTTTLEKYKKEVRDIKNVFTKHD